MNSLAFVTPNVCVLRHNFSQLEADNQDGSSEANLRVSLSSGLKARKSTARAEWNDAPA